MEYNPWKQIQRPEKKGRDDPVKVGRTTKGERKGWRLTKVDICA